ncbi:MAG TPA: hypothetical protein VGK50_06030 [Coriobacteriia bacterium]|jgi:hypothetical protein
MSTTRRRLGGLASICVSATAFVLLLGLAAPAFAAAVPYAQWRVALWPEYDDERTLVIYEPRLDASAALPFKFTYDAFPLDAQVGMTCQVTPVGQHQCQQRQTSVTGDLESISYTAPSERQLYMEYYTDMLKGQRPTQRKMTYSFVAPADIADLQVSIRQPKDATGFTVTPNAASRQTDGDGFTLDTFGFQNVKAGQRYSFTFAYSRPTWTPPVTKAQNNGAQGGQGGAGQASAGQQPGGSQNSQLFALIAVAAFIGAFVMLLMRRPAPAAAPASVKSSAKGKGHRKPSPKGGSRGTVKRSGA